MEVFTEEQALCEGIKRVAQDGLTRGVVNSSLDVIWELEADTKVDDEELVYPVIVHMRGALGSEQCAILFEGTQV